MISHEKQGDIIVRGHRPTTGLDRTAPPRGGSVVTKQLKTIRQSVQSPPKLSVQKHEK